MSGKTLIRKYRPLQLDDLIGQERIAATLKKAVQHDRVADAYLFAGNRGCGKTSSARILAMLLNCENVKDFKVCGKCHACTSIHSGLAMDVREVDAASNNGVEDARRLIEASSHGPQVLKRKVYIIDECHELTGRANNALLKVIEEPPSYLTFVFCTTEPDKMLPTVLSRCQKHEFRRIPSKTIALHLLELAKEEKINIANDAAYFLAQKAEGSMRDAIGYLDQIGTLAADKEITEVHARKLFGSADRIAILDMIKAMKNGNLPLVMDQVNDMVLSCARPMAIMKEVLKVFRDLMVIKASGGSVKNVDLPDHEIKKLMDVGEDLSLGGLVKLQLNLANVEEKMRYHVDDRGLMEAALIQSITFLKCK